VLGDLSGGVELLFVDDGSRDGSLEDMRKIAAMDRRVRVLALDGQYGQSSALEAGFRAVRGEITATLETETCRTTRPTFPDSSSTSPTRTSSTACGPIGTIPGCAGCRRASATAFGTG
jgi:hypothetical protein